MLIRDWLDDDERIDREFRKLLFRCACFAAGLIFGWELWTWWIQS